MFPFGILFTLFFILFFVAFFIILFRGLSQWRKNNKSPRLTVQASVVAKRTRVSHSHSGTGEAMLTDSYTYYYVTFEVESGDRMELSVSGNDYGLIAEGDVGKLTFQGTRFLSFERDR